MDALALVAAADRIGIVAFAISGVAVGIRARMDLYGIFTLGLVAAIGGGVTRDVVLGQLPLVFVNTDYLLWAALSAAGAIGIGAIGWTAPGPLMKTADALGTGAFAAAGALLAYEAGLTWPGGLLVAIITATGGGVLRDVLASEVPNVLRTDLNATGAAAGGVLTFVLIPALDEFALILGGLVAALITAVGHLRLIRMPALPER